MSLWRTWNCVCFLLKQSNVSLHVYHKVYIKRLPCAMVLTSIDNRKKNASIRMIKKCGLVKHLFDKIKCFKHWTGAQITLFVFLDNQKIPLRWVRIKSASRVNTLSSELVISTQWKLCGVNTMVTACCSVREDFKGGLGTSWHWVLIIQINWGNRMWNSKEGSFLIQFFLFVCLDKVAKRLHKVPELLFYIKILRRVIILLFSDIEIFKSDFKFF